MAKKLYGQTPFEYPTSSQGKKLAELTQVNWR
jgi:hypothetical protein